jgi:hypothetical protein
MPKSSAELTQIAAGYLLAAGNAAKREQTKSPPIQTGSPYLSPNHPAFTPYVPTYNPYTTGYQVVKGQKIYKK